MADKITTAAAYGTSGATFIFGMTVNEFAALGGLALAALTFIVNFYFKQQHLKLAREKAQEIEDD